MALHSEVPRFKSPLSLMRRLRYWYPGELLVGHSRQHWRWESKGLVCCDASSCDPYRTVNTGAMNSFSSSVISLSSFSNPFIPWLFKSWTASLSGFLLWILLKKCLWFVLMLLAYCLPWCFYQSSPFNFCFTCLNIGLYFARPNSAFCSLCWGRPSTF